MMETGTANTEACVDRPVLCNLFAGICNEKQSKYEANKSFFFSQDKKVFAINRQVASVYVIFFLPIK